MPGTGIASPWLVIASIVISRVAARIRRAALAGAGGAGRGAPPGRLQLAAYSFLALSAVMATVGTVTEVSTEVAQSIRIFRAMSIASGAPVG